MTSIRTETETVIKKILPYLRRREYDIETDLDFETSVKTTDRYSRGYADILVMCGQAKPIFIIEAKRSSRILSEKDRDQAIEYGESFGCLFVVVTNGADIRCYNVSNKKSIRWNGKLVEKIPTRSQLQKVVSALKADKQAVDIALSGDQSLPFRPGLPLKQLNALFARCHNAIRKIEKDEDNAFADFSKLLFLKMLEEKADMTLIANTSSEAFKPAFTLPYSTRFHELAERPESESDQVQVLIEDMIKKIRAQTLYGDVLAESLRLKNPKTFRYIVRELAAVSFQDSTMDSKGAAFEYFVRATLKGKRLGQYFTPRELIEIMSCIVGREKILNALMAGSKVKVLDPACGTGGFLVFLMQENLRLLEERLRTRSITQKTYRDISERIMRQVLYGSDANNGVAAAAKMNMIIAGDGHTNIRAEDSLPLAAQNWNFDQPDCDIILTNPPFGTSESQSLLSKDLNRYPIRSTKGQILFIQKMVLCATPEGDICTVIDEGVLNTDSVKRLRRWLFEKCRVLAVVRLPEETFKPNKINVRASVLYLQRREHDDIDCEDNYNITFCDIESLGYNGAGDSLRGFDFKRLADEISTKMLDTTRSERSGYKWSAFNVQAQEILANEACRLDYKYWLPSVRQRIAILLAAGAPTIKDLNLIPTDRGNSPNAELYVDEADGYALVVKAGSNISKYGELLTDGDYIEKNVYDEMMNVHLKDGDILLSSTGDGTIGKCCVYRSEKFAIADGHVTIIRVDPDKVWPEYLADYLRAGFGEEQVNRLFTGSTGLVELTKEHVKSVVVNLLSDVDEQKKVSTELRAREAEHRQAVQDAEAILEEARKKFLQL
ncbi:MAG: N-6 DNA methylase [Anaerolineae bacterium]